MAFSCRFFSGFFFFFASVDRLDRFSAFFFKRFRSRNVEWADFPCLFSSSVFPSSCTDIDWADFPRPFLQVVQSRTIRWTGFLRLFCKEQFQAGEAGAKEILFAASLLWGELSDQGCQKSTVHLFFIEDFFLKRPFSRPKKSFVHLSFS